MHTPVQRARCRPWRRDCRAADIRSQLCSHLRRLGVPLRSALAGRDPGSEVEEALVAVRWGGALRQLCGWALASWQERRLGKPPGQTVASLFIAEDVD